MLLSLLAFVALLETCVVIVMLNYTQVLSNNFGVSSLGSMTNLVIS